MNQWSYYNPVSIQYTDDYIQFFAESLIQHKRKNNVVLFCYRWFEDTKQFERLINSLNKPFVYSEIEENPSLTSCQKAIVTIKDINPDIIVAIGGGSVIDTAKVVRASLYKNIFNINELFNKVSIKKKIPKLIAVPTTHGTGSEVTMWATVWDKEKKEKKSLSEIENYPSVAVYDLALVEDLPVNISIITTLDALSHSFEAICNKNRNPISTQYAIQAIKLIYENIGGINDQTSLETRRNLLLAASYAGLAFSNTKTAAAHSISYPLTLRYNIPHGIACSMTLYPIMQLNYSSIKEELDDLVNILQVSNVNEFFNKIHKNIKEKVLINLHEYGVEKSDLQSIINESFTEDRMENNIIKFNRNQIKWILEEVF